MNSNQLLDAPDAPAQTVNTTAIEKWVGYAEYIPLIFFPIGYLFKIQSWAYSESIYTWSILSYAALLFFIPFLVFQGRGLGQIIISYLMGIAFFVLLMGKLFQIQSWQYAREMMTSAYAVLPFMTVGALVVFGVYYKNLQSRNFAANILVRLLVFGFIGLLYSSLLLIVYKMVKPQIFKPE
jgi:hypothetical protein